MYQLGIVNGYRTNMRETQFCAFSPGGVALFHFNSRLTADYNLKSIQAKGRSILIPIPCQLKSVVIFPVVQTCQII